MSKTRRIGEPSHYKLIVDDVSLQQMNMRVFLVLGCGGQICLSLVLLWEVLHNPEHQHLCSCCQDVSCSQLFQANIPILTGDQPNSLWDRMNQWSGRCYSQLFFPPLFK